MKNSEDLRRALRAIDHKSYPAYKDLKASCMKKKHLDMKDV